MAKTKSDKGSSPAGGYSRYIPLGVSCIVAAAVFWFWAFPYRSALSYREQFQLFQSTGAYLSGLASRPGGISVYVGEFLSQFFIIPWAGGIVMSLLMLSVLWLCACCCKRFAPSTTWTLASVASLIPVVALWACLGNQYITLGFVVALCLSLALAICLVALEKRLPAWLACVVQIPVVALAYWTAGPAAWLCALLGGIFIRLDRRLPVVYRILSFLISLLWLAANIHVWSLYLPYPLTYQLIGIGYALMPDTFYPGAVVAEALCVLVPVSAIWASRVPTRIIVPTLAGAVVAAVAILYPRCYDKATYDMIGYDYMVRTADWDGIIDRSLEEDPDTPLALSATNLALAMKGRLDTDAFQYPQHGTEGLIPPFSKETLVSWTAGEIFFHLGLVNSAQRFYFEGMEAIPNYNKSSRAIRRLAETAIIRGEYAVAEKYLRLLENTTLYKTWARANLELIRNPEAIKSHPVYGPLRKGIVDDDYLFNSENLDKPLAEMIQQGSDNVLVRQYLIVYCLLQRDLYKLLTHLDMLFKVQPGYNPLLAQQGMAFLAVQSGQPIPPNLVSDEVAASVRDFAMAWNSNGMRPMQNYMRSVYYYLAADK